MVLALYALSDAKIEQVLADPPLVMKVIAPDDPEAYEGIQKGQPSRPLFGGLFGRAERQRKRGAAAAFTLGEGEGDTTDLDKAWQAIHYLLTGTADAGSAPLNFLLRGGRKVGTLEVGYEPARVMTSAETAQADAALTKIDDAELRRRFDPVRMMQLKIYPEIWDRNPREDDTLGYVMERVGALREFVAGAANRRMGLVFALM